MSLGGTTFAPATVGAMSGFLASCTWALGTSVYSKLSRENSAVAVNFARAWVALPLFILAEFITAGGIHQGLAEYAVAGWSHLGWMSLSMVASYGMGDVIFLWSTRSLGVPGALAIASSYPFWTAWVGVIFEGQILRPAQWFGLVVTLCGIVLVILNSPRAPDRSASSMSTDPSEELAKSRKQAQHAAVPWKGIALAVLASFFWSLNSYSVARGSVGVSVFVGNTLRMSSGVVLSYVLGRFLAPNDPILMPWKTVKPFLWLFALESFGGSFFYMTAFSKAPLVIAATMCSLAPVISVPVALAFGMEKFSLFRTAGVALVAIGLSVLCS